MLTSVTGLWKTKSEKVPDKFKEVEYSELYDPADIKGSYTFSEISRLYNIPIEDLSAAFGIKESNSSDFKCKDLESIYEDSQYEIGTASVRMFTAYYLGLPYEQTEETYLQETAVKILKEKGNMDKEQLDYIESHTIPNI